VDRNVSCVISTFGMPKAAQRHLIAEFAEEILNINNTPRHVFIEEAHEFVPQRVFGAMGKTFNAVSNLVVMGRNRGLGVTLINQRAATINKDVLTQLDTLLAFQNVSPQDRKALKDWVEYHAAEGDFEKFMKSLPSLPKGEGWIWSPEFLGIFERIKIRPRNTFHPDREKLGSKFQMPELDIVDVEAFIAEFGKEVVISKSSKETAKPVPVKKDDAEIIVLRNEYESRLLAKDVENRNLQAVIDNVQRAVGGVSVSALPAGIKSLKSDIISLWQGKLGDKSGAARIFKFLSENPGRKFSKTQIGLAVGLKSTTGSFNTYMSKLKSNKLIVKDGTDYKLNPDL